MIGRKISHFRILDVIGGGGMGMVYRAEDLKLGRRVALKFLPEELTGDPAALKRFEREAQTASALNHPNICTIYTIDDFEGQPFIAMELLEGSTLRDRLASEGGGAFTAEETARLAAQICSGLEAAHDKGVIHRDIKPANIFITREQVPKLLDFGLAKLMDDESLASPAEGGKAGSQDSHIPYDSKASLTTTGVAIGTAGYMSPEQIRREKLDGRSDLFSFGLVLFEMTSGQRAFQGNSIAAIQEAIETQDPTPALKASRTIPAGLINIICRALKKNREDRFQSAEEMRLELERLFAPKKLLPIRVVRAAVAACLAIAAVVGGIYYWHIRNAEQLALHDTVVVADVTNKTTDPVLDDAMNMAINIALTQTPYFDVLTPDKVRAVMSELRQDPTGKISPEIAHQVCFRTNSKAVISSSIEDMGNGYGFTLDALDCSSGKSFAQVRGSATRDKLIQQLGTAVERLRRKAGEPRSSIARYSKPLEIASSASPEALHYLAEAYRRHMSLQRSAIPEYQLAIDVDPNLALAYAGVGAMSDNINLTDQARKYTSKAYELRDRLTTRDRDLVETLYAKLVLGQTEPAIPVFRQWVEEFPTDVRARVNFASALVLLGQFDEAVVQDREAVRLWPAQLPYFDLIGQLALAGRLDESLAASNEAKKLHVDNPTIRHWALVVAEVLGSNSEIKDEEAYAKLHPDFLSQVESVEADWEYNRGHFRQANALDNDGNSHQPKDRRDRGMIDSHFYRAGLYIEAGDLSNAKRELAAAAAMPKIGLNADEDFRLSLDLARCGLPDLAEKYLALAVQDKPQKGIQRLYEEGVIRAVIQLGRNDAAGAIRTLEPLRPYDDAYFGDAFTGLFPAYYRGLAYLKLGDGRSAAAEFQKFAGHEVLVSKGFTSLNSLWHLQLARAQMIEGDKDAARNSYQQFLALWKDADSDLPAYREAKAEYATLLQSLNRKD
ncbi:MAG TPA: protein kinase [Verrucomicrobiae bacterium]|nr:protein kinase [Verrucomicrobiae bacterium]